MFSTNFRHKKVGQNSQIPPPWFQRFSKIIPLSLVCKLASTCQEFHFLLTMNAAWKPQCERLEDYSKLSDYEKNVMIMPEGFWFQWYLDHVPRHIPIFTGQLTTINGIGCPKLGQLYMTSYNLSLNSGSYRVVIEPTSLPQGKKTGRIVVSNVEKSYKTKDNKQIAIFKKVNRYIVTIRTNGNLAISMVPVTLQG